MEYWKKLKTPFMLLVVFFSLWIIWKVLDLPPQNEMIEIIRKYFALYGNWLILVSAFLEGTLLLGLYYPGSMVILLGVMFAGGNIKNSILVVVFASTGLFIAYLLDYFLGKYGWYKLLVKFGLEEQIEKTKKKLERYEMRAIFLSYWHPNFAALTSTAAGILQFSLKKFAIYSVIVLVIWNIFWGTIAYFFGELALNSIIGIKFIIAVLIIWTILILIFERKKNHTML